jgi:hypothetical protein
MCNLRWVSQCSKFHSSDASSTSLPSLCFPDQFLQFQLQRPVESPSG